MDMASCKFLLEGLENTSKLVHLLYKASCYRSAEDRSQYRQSLRFFGLETTESSTLCFYPSLHPRWIAISRKRVSCVNFGIFFVPCALGIHRLASRFTTSASEKANLLSQGSAWSCHWNPKDQSYQQPITTSHCSQGQQTLAFSVFVPAHSVCPNTKLVQE